MTDYFDILPYDDDYEVNSPQMPEQKPKTLKFNNVFEAKNFIMATRSHGTIMTDSDMIKNVRIDCRRKPMNFPVYFTFNPQ